MDRTMSRTASIASPEDLEQAFYDALSQGDADLLMQFWAEDEETLCVHPTGVRLTGIPAIRESWQGIFANARLRVEAEQMAHWQGSMLAIHHLTEVLFVGDDPSPHGPLPDVLVGGVAKALAKRPDDRFRNAAEMRAVLELALLLLGGADAR
jgi:ketosteroid isomerase-like protein